MTARKLPAKPAAPKPDPKEAVLQQVAMQLINAIVGRASLQNDGVDAIIADLRQQLSDVQMECAEIAAERNAAGS